MMKAYKTIVNCKVLDLGGNRIKKIENLQNLVRTKANKGNISYRNDTHLERIQTELKELWLNNNFLSDFKDLENIKVQTWKSERKV